MVMMNSSDQDAVRFRSAEKLIYESQLLTLTEAAPAGTSTMSVMLQSGK